MMAGVRVQAAAIAGLNGTRMKDGKTLNVRRANKDPRAPLGATVAPPAGEPAAMGPPGPATAGATAGATEAGGMATATAAAKAAASESTVEQEAGGESPTRFLQLSGMCVRSELTSLEEARDVVEDTRYECSRFGTVSGVYLPLPSHDGPSYDPPGVTKLCIEFASVQAAKDSQVSNTLFPPPTRGQQALALQ